MQHSCQCNWLTSWMNQLQLCVDWKKFDFKPLYALNMSLFISCVYVWPKSKTKQKHSISKNGFYFQKCIPQFEAKPPSRYSNELSMLSLIFILIHAFSVVDSVDSFNFRLSIDFTRPIWLINRVHRASNRWREMMNRFTGRRSIHFPMRQMLHDRQAANRFAHIHATTLTHGIWRIMHIFKGMGNRLRGSRFFVIDIAFNLIDNRTEINIHEYRPTKSMTSLSAT